MYKIQPIKVAYQNLKFYAPFKGLSNFEKTVIDFSVLYPKKSGLNKKLKVDIRIKQSRLKISHSKVPSSGQTKLLKVPRVPPILHEYCGDIVFL